MNNIIEFIKSEKYALFFELIVVLMGMLLAMTLDGLKEDYNENKTRIENFTKDKTNLNGIYASIRYQVAADTLAMTQMLSEIEEVNLKVEDFALYGLISAADFKKCEACLESIFKSVKYPINNKEYNKIFNSALYELNNSYLNTIDWTDENIELFDLISDANFNIDYFYSEAEENLHNSKKLIDRDAESNINYYKMHFPNFYRGMSALDVNSSIFLNMLVARKNLMDEYINNLEYMILDSRELLESLDAAIYAINNSLE